MDRSILVVDDDPHIRDVIRFALGKAGHATRVARDGDQALAEFGRELPRLIVLDVGLPGVDGLEVCRRVRRTSDVPILFLSSRDEEIDRVLGLEIGGDDYVTKPFSPRELVARVDHPAPHRGAAPRPGGGWGLASRPPGTRPTAARGNLRRGGGRAYGGRGS
jgi:two-component system OmpR family response regulator